MNKEQRTAARIRARVRLLVVHCSLLIFHLLVLAACTLPQEQPLPDGVTDQRADLVERIKDTPTDLDAHADLLRMQIKSGDRAGAETTVAHALKHNAKDYRAHLLEAQYHRWQLDLITTEKALLKARTIAPDRLEPCIALAGLYNQAYLDSDELQLRQVALDLAPAELRAEFLLDLAYCQWQLRNAAEATKLSAVIAADKQVPAGLRGRNLLLHAEILLNAGETGPAAEAVGQAHTLAPEDAGTLQFAARAAILLGDSAPLRGVFEQTLVGKDRAELRWTALFGLWTLALHNAMVAGTDPLADDVEAWRKRIEAMEPGHPDVAGRYYQLLKLNPDRAEEAKTLGEQLEEIGLGKPPVPSTHKALLALWRVEDALRVGAADPAIAEIIQLRKAEGNLEGSRMLQVMALFKARKDAECLRELDTWLAESDKTDDILLSLRWWILLRGGRSVDVLTDIQKRGGENNSRQWLEAVAKFQTYRAAARKGE